MTKSTKANNPSIKMGGMKIFEASGGGRGAGCQGSANEAVDGSCLKKGASKSEIADQIGLHLRTVYDDILAQPVPGRFLELLRQLENSTLARSSKDGM